MDLINYGVFVPRRSSSMAYLLSPTWGNEELLRMHYQTVTGLTDDESSVSNIMLGAATTSPSTPGISRAPSVCPECGPILQLSRLTYRYPYHRSGQNVTLGARFLGNP